MNFPPLSHLSIARRSFWQNLCLNSMPFPLHFLNWLQEYMEVPVFCHFSWANRSSWNLKTKGELLDLWKNLHVFAQGCDSKAVLSISLPFCRWWTQEIWANFAWFLHKYHMVLQRHLQKAKLHIKIHTNKLQETTDQQDCYTLFQEWYLEPCSEECQ